MPIEFEERQSMTHISRRTLIAAASAAPFAYALGSARAASAAPNPAATTAALPGPAAHWAFDEGSGSTAADAAGNGNPLTLTGKAGWGEGRTGAHSLDTTATGSAERSGPVVDTSGAFSASAWVRLSRADGYQTFVSCDGAAVSAFFLQLRADTGAFAFTRLPADSTDANNAAAVAGATFAPETGTWYHLLGVDDPAEKTVKLYVNGILEGEADYSSGWKNTAGRTAVGRGFFGGAPVDQAYALIDEVAVYATALTADQAAALAGVDPADTRPLLTIDTAAHGPTVSPELGGIFFEDINHSGEGGLYAELVNNRSFMAASTPLHWSATGAGAITIDTSVPLNTALTQSLKLTVAAAGDGISNEGFWGIPVRPRTTYRASLHARGGYRGRLTVSLVGKDGTVHATATTAHVGADWQRYDLKLRTGAHAPTTADAVLRVTTDSGAAAGDTVWFSQVSLFPPTYRNRPNGLRVDLVEKLAALEPAFLRFPGGNYLEGNVIADRFDWKKTIGPVEERPGHRNSAWGYWSTDGLGLLEYLQLTEDLGCAPLLCVFAGYALRGAHVTGDALKPFVQDAVDEIEYLIGSTSTTWGSRRAADGHPEPFPLKYVEIGNEDWFDTSGSYEERYAAFYDAIRAKYPHLKLIATTPVSSRPYDLIDEHYYQSPSAFQHGSHKYDNRDRTTPKVFVGEWASQQGRPTPNLNAALGDASWLTGLIRNSDQVLMESYAPLFSHVSDNTWATNLIAYSPLTSYNSPSYYAQQLLRTHRGSVVVPTTARALPGLNTVTTRDPATGRLYAAVVNFGSTARTTDIVIAGAAKVRAKGSVTVLAGTAPTDTNTLTDPERLVPVTRKVTGIAPSFPYVFPPYSVTVLEVGTHR
ncbi:alpha-L-arabinofuranosidase C-terminal domain-containing protein [Streptomyces sp. NPDC051320]|uniref:alpha-L-arabinofuranosidase C-terminal domain-containing protein n=1 Tax=Streptomyces sp. NPDC051320 TaxID=3154644 RepID=UPI00341EA2B7